MAPAYQAILSAVGGGIGEVTETVDAGESWEVADGAKRASILSRPRMPGPCGRVLPLALPCAWVHSVRGGTSEACRRHDVRTLAICPMPARR